MTRARSIETGGGPSIDRTSTSVHVRAQAVSDDRDRATRAWVDQNLFNGEFYVQHVRGIPSNEIAKATIGDMGSDRPDEPEFQLANGCLADQLIGQYLADVAGLGPLLTPANIRTTLGAIRKYNYRAQLVAHDSVQRVYALNDEPALLVCDYTKSGRPKIPFPYYQEAWTGIEYLVAAQFIQAGMLREGLGTIEDVRRRYDGERRNPWDEPECGHHYARAMSAWSSLIAFTGFDYHGVEKALTLAPKSQTPAFTSFYSTGLGWGMFSIARTAGANRLELGVTEGSLPLRSIRLNLHPGAKTAVTLAGRTLEHTAERRADGVTIVLAADLAIPAGGNLIVQL